MYFFLKWWQNSLLFNLLDNWPSMFCLKVKVVFELAYAVKANKLKLINVKITERNFSTILEKGVLCQAKKSNSND